MMTTLKKIARMLDLRKKGWGFERARLEVHLDNRDDIKAASKIWDADVAKDQQKGRRPPPQ